MDCLFINPDNKLDELVKLGLENKEIIIHHLKSVHEFLESWNFDEYKPGVLIIHLDTILSSDRSTQLKLIDPFTYTAIITGHKERPPEGEFIWDSNVFTLTAAIEMFEYIVLNGFDYLSARSKRKIFDKFEIFSLPVIGNRLVRIKAQDIISIRASSEGLQVTTQQDTYITPCKTDFFHNIDLLPDFKFVDPDTVLNINMISDLSQNLINMNNGKSFTLKEEFSKEFFATLELPSRKFYFRSWYLHNP